MPNDNTENPSYTRKPRKLAGLAEKVRMRPIFFCHIPKTAGTALRLALEKNFDQSEILPNRSDLENNKGQYPPVDFVIKRLAENKSYKLVSGHYPMSLARYMSNPRIIVVLREPTERIISLFNHKISRGLTTAEEIEKSLEKGVVPTKENSMAKNLAPDAENSSKDRLLNRAIDVLRRIDIVGVSENMEEISKKLEKWSIYLPNDRVNVAKNELIFKSEYMDLIREKNEVDEKVYEMAKTM